jgi:hypothetical protein
MISPSTPASLSFSVTIIGPFSRRTFGSSSKSPC